MSIERLKEGTKCSVSPNMNAGFGTHAHIRSKLSRVHTKSLEPRGCKVEVLVAATQIIKGRPGSIGSKEREETEWLRWKYEQEKGVDDFVVVVLVLVNQAGTRGFR